MYQVGRVKPIGVEFACENTVSFSPAMQHKVQFTPALILPVPYLVFETRGPKGVEDQMFPKDSSILVTNRIPTARARYEPRVKSIDLRAADDFASAAAMERGHQKHCMGDSHRF
jgi:hypothetical protein